METVVEVDSHLEAVIADRRREARGTLAFSPKIL
jgi:hypothetical protein